MKAPSAWVSLAAVLAVVGLVQRAPVRAAQDPQAHGPSSHVDRKAVVPGLSVRITSPLGRTGTPTTVLIVAQIQMEPAVQLEPVAFFVDGAPVGTVQGGPPYAVPWADENPFERREITVRVRDAQGRTAEDRVVLDPFQVSEVASVRSILIDASVYDQKGRFVQDLDASHFRVTEDGTTQHPDLVQQEDVPATFLLLVDGSQSMAPRMTFVRDATARIISYLGPHDRIIVAPFGLHLRPVTGPTDDRATVSEAIGSIRAGGGTAIHDALAEAAALLKDVSGRRVIVLVTDGYDENSRRTPQDCLAAVKAAQTTIYAIGIGGVAGISLEGEAFLRDVARAAGGRAYFPYTETALAQVYDTLAADAQHRYLITYTPSNQRLDGKWRTIAVATDDHAEVVLSRTGYQAPAPPPIKPSIEFTVTDLQQRYVDVAPEDLAVVENGVEQHIEAFQEAVTPVSIVLALDRSGSMKKSSPQVMDAARGFVTSLRAEDSLAMLLFSDNVFVAHALSTNRDWSLQAIDGYQAVGGTALYDALFGSLQMLKTVEDRRALVVVTDGVDEDRAGKHAGSVHTLDDVLGLAKEVDATIFTVGLGQQVDRTVLGRLAKVSGGAAYFPADSAALTEQYANIVENLRRRFVIGYTSTHVDRDGAWRTVEIKDRRPGVKIAARSGYFAPDR